MSRVQPTHSAAFTFSGKWCTRGSCVRKGERRVLGGPSSGELFLTTRKVLTYTGWSYEAKIICTSRIYFTSASRGPSGNHQLFPVTTRDNILVNSQITYLYSKVDHLSQTQIYMIVHTHTRSYIRYHSWNLIRSINISSDQVIREDVRERGKSQVVKLKKKNNKRKFVPCTVSTLQIFVSIIHSSSRVVVWLPETGKMCTQCVCIPAAETGESWREYLLNGRRGEFRCLHCLTLRQMKKKREH